MSAQAGTHVKLSCRYKALRQRDRDTRLLILIRTPSRITSYIDEWCRLQNKITRYFSLMCTILSFFKIFYNKKVLLNYIKLHDKRWHIMQENILTKNISLFIIYTTKEKPASNIMNKILLIIFSMRYQRKILLHFEKYIQNFISNQIRGYIYF